MNLLEKGLDNLHLMLARNAQQDVQVDTGISGSGSGSSTGASPTFTGMSRTFSNTGVSTGVSTDGPGGHGDDAEPGGCDAGGAGAPKG